MSNTPVDKINPANPIETSVGERDRIPMSVPTQRLSAPDIPGFHTHWMMGNPARIAQAQNAGYDFVTRDEVRAVQRGVASGLGEDGSSDLGSRVSVLAGSGSGEDGQAERLYLMKIRQEWWEKDQQALEDRNEQIAEALRGGRAESGNPYGGENRYIPQSAQQAAANLFTRKNRRTI